LQTPDSFLTVAGAVLDFHEFPDSRAMRAPENLRRIMGKIIAVVQPNDCYMSQIDYICVDTCSVA
jgi:hypothetical protein